MALTSPGLTLAVPAMFGNIKPAISTLTRIGMTDFSADAPSTDVKPGATVKIPVSSVSAASAYNDSTNNYLTGGSTNWATLTASHYLQGFDIKGANIDEGVDAAKIKQLFAYRAGKGIASAVLGNVRDALDGVTASTAVTIPAVASVTITDYLGLSACKPWLNGQDSVLVVNGTEYAKIKAVFAAQNVIGDDKALASFLGFADLVCVAGMTARAVIVPNGSVGFIGRVPAIIARYMESGTQTDEDTGLAVGIVVADDQDHNRLVVNADLWFGSTVLSAPATAATAGCIKVGTAAA